MGLLQAKNVSVHGFIELENLSAFYGRVQTLCIMRDNTQGGGHVGPLSHVVVVVCPYLKNRFLPFWWVGITPFRGEDVTMSNDRPGRRTRRLTWKCSEATREGRKVKGWKREREKTRLLHLPIMLHFLVQYYSIRTSSNYKLGSPQTPPISQGRMV